MALLNRKACESCFVFQLSVGILLPLTVKLNFMDCMTDDFIVLKYSLACIGLKKPNTTEHVRVCRFIPLHSSLMPVNPSLLILYSAAVTCKIN